MRQALVLLVFAPACTLLTDLDGLRGAGALDAAADAVASDASASDASAWDPGVVDCFGFGGCTGGDVCCSTFGCIAPSSDSLCLQQDGGSIFECDEALDCPSADSCCFTHARSAGKLGALCSRPQDSWCSFDPDDVFACKTDSDCVSSLTHCESVTCFGETIRTCGGACPQ